MKGDSLVWMAKDVIKSGMLVWMTIVWYEWRKVGKNSDMLLWMANDGWYAICKYEWREFSMKGDRLVWMSFFRVYVQELVWMAIGWYEFRAVGMNEDNYVWMTIGW